MISRQLRKLPALRQLPISQYSSAAAAEQFSVVNDFRTAEQEVAAHSAMHEAKFYTIPPETKKLLFSSGGLPRQFEVQTKTFAETCLMVRPAALELMDYIRRTDPNRPTTRFVLYGENGVGKSLTMAHVLHFGHQNGYVLVHVPWLPNWMKRPKEIANSSSKEGFIDLPFDGAAWLLHFKSQNAKLLPTLELKTSQDYVWSKRETTPKGAPISELVEHGISRVKFASEAISALLGELKLQATAGRCKVMVAIDGFNAFFHPETRILTDNKQRVTPDRITLTQPFLDITNYDWTHGVCILSMDKIAMTEGYMDSYMPRYLLGKTGFEHLDPFVPLHVQKYSDKEFYNCISYYLDRNWIQKTPEGFEEQLKHLSNQNPYTLMQLTRSL